MNLDELVLKSLGKRPLLREKIKEERRRELYSSIENIENLISKKNELATKIMKSTLLNLDCSKDRVEFEKIEKSIDELLLKNGFSKEYLNKYYVCEKCKDTGYYNGSVCSCIMKDLVEDRVLESGFSNKKREQNFSNFDFSLFEGNFEHVNRLVNSREYMEKLINFSKDYCDNLIFKDYGIFFYGKSGAGKTYFASAMVNYLLDMGKRACFITATEFFELMANYSYSFYRDKKELQDRIDFIRNVDFLVIDDLGNEISNKNNNSFLSSLLDYRFEKGLNTVITSNLSEYDLAEYYDSRVASRIRGNFKFLVFPPSDLREKIGKNMKL
ncbi:ATP-binding protein [Parvimonas sp. G1967]|uniref:ATP-binding protein n=1 Tax=Parvimonas sp. G1967 TaxID=3387695 RepID=UPI0039E65008